MLKIAFVVLYVAAEYGRRMFYVLYAEILDAALAYYCKLLSHCVLMLK